MSGSERIAAMLAAGGDERAFAAAVEQVGRLLQQMSKFKGTALEQRWRVFCGQIVGASTRARGKETLTETRVVRILAELLLLSGMSHTDALSAAKLHVSGAVAAGILVRKRIGTSGTATVAEVLTTKNQALPWHVDTLPDQFVALIDILFDYGGKWVAARDVNRALGHLGIGKRNAAQIMGDAAVNGHTPHKWVENSRKQYRLLPKHLGGV